MIKDFFNNIDGRIFSFDFSAISSKVYLLHDPGDEFTFLSWAVVIFFLLTVTSILGLLYAKRPRKKINKLVRFALKGYFLRNVYLGISELILIFLRAQGVKYLEKRVWSLFVVILLLGNLGYLLYEIIKMKRLEPDQKIKVSEDFQKYLPRKKKK